MELGWTVDAIAERGADGRTPLLSVSLAHRRIEVFDDCIKLCQSDASNPTIVRLNGTVHTACAARHTGHVLVSLNRKRFRCEPDDPIGRYFLSSHHTVLFDPDSGSTLDLDAVPTRMETDHAISPNGRYLATFRPENAIWSTVDGTRLAPLDRSGLLFKAAVFDSRSEYIAALFDGNPNIFAELSDTTPWQSELRVWRCDGSVVFVHRQPYVDVSQLAVSDDGAAIIGLDDQHKPAVVWNAQTGKACTPTGAPRARQSDAVMRPRNRRDADRRPRLVVSAVGTVARTTDKPQPPCAMVSGTDIHYPFALCTVGATAAALAWPDRSDSQPDIVRWHAATDRRLPVLVAPNSNAPLSCLALSEDGQWVAAGGADWCVYVWSLATNELCATLSQHRAPIVSIVFSQDSSRLYSLCDDDVIIAWHQAPRASTPGE